MGRTAFGAFVYETPAEFFSNGDFNGDGRIDVVVLDRATGNARVGFQTATGALNWSAAVATGVPQPASLAVGRFAQSTRDAIAVTSPGLNRIHVLDLSSNSPAPSVVWGAHNSPAMLVGLDSPFGTAQSLSSLAVGSPDYGNPGDPGITILDLFGFLAENVFFQDQIVAEGFLGSANAFRRNTADATSLAAMRRGSNDTFLVYSYTNTAAPLLALPNLPPGSEYVFGHFNGEPLPRLLFYVPGESNIIVRSLIHNAGVLAFGPATLNTFASSIERVFFIDEQTNGLVVVRFGDGVVSGLRPPAGGGNLAVASGFAVGPAGNVMNGALSLGNGRLALLSAISNSISSAQAQVFTRSGGGYTQTSTSTLPETTSIGTRANVWLFANEPFVNSQPVFIASVSGGDWVTSLTGLPGVLNIVSETDRGTSLGLGNATGQSLGAAPGNAPYGIPNQHHSAISLFSYSAPRQAEPVRVTISPNPGYYASPVNVSFTTSPMGEPVYYRVGAAGAFNPFAGPFTLGSNAMVQFYATTAGGTQRSSTHSATYTFGSQNLGQPPVLSTNGTPETNQPPPGTETNFQFAAVGTVFYSRASGSTGSIWAINLDGTRDRFITEGVRPRVSPDGHYMAFTRERSPMVFEGNLWVRDLWTGTEWRMLNQTNVIVGYDWDADSAALFHDQDCVIRRTDLQGNSSILPLLADCYRDAPARNPIDDRLAFHSLHPAAFIPALSISPPPYSAQQRLGITTPNNARWVSWSPDGTLLAYAAAPGLSIFAGRDLWVLEPDGSAQYQITAFSGANGFVNGALWTPDGNALIGAATVAGLNGIWMVELTADRHACGRPPTRLPTTPGDAIDFVGSVFVPPRMPPLLIRHETGEVVLSWEQTTLEVVLESSFVLGPGVVWTRIAGPYPVAGAFHEVRFPDAALAPASFFRLRWP